MLSVRHAGELMPQCGLLAESALSTQEFLFKGVTLLTQYCSRSGCTLTIHLRSCAWKFRRPSCCVNVCVGAGSLCAYWSRWMWKDRYAGNAGLTAASAVASVVMARGRLFITLDTQTMLLIPGFIQRCCLHLQLGRPPLK